MMYDLRICDAWYLKAIHFLILYKNVNIHINVDIDLFAFYLKIRKHHF